MRVVVITPPAPVVTWEDAEAHLKLEGDVSYQVEVEGLIAAVVGHLDGPNGWLGRALGPQTLEARLDNFDCGSIRLPYSPIIDIVSVKYVDAAGTLQTIAADCYELVGDALMPLVGLRWPVPRWAREAVRVQYRAGYAALPPQIRVAILLMLHDLWKHRGNTATGATVTKVPMPTSAEALLGPMQVFR
jgi:uncharacterized phiE125 gp8 family phage protein